MLQNMKTAMKEYCFQKFVCLCLTQITAGTTLYNVSFTHPGECNELYNSGQLYLVKYIVMLF